MEGDMKHIMKMDFYRVFCRSRFWAATIAVALLWEAAGRRFLSYGDVLGIIFHGTGRSTVNMIAVIVCNVTYGLGVCEDMQNGTFWNLMSRVSKKKYAFSKIISVMIGTTSCYVLGTMTYILMMTVRYPLVLENSIAVENLKELSSFSFLLPQHPMLYLIIQLLLTGLCCSWLGCFAVAFSACLRDSFVTLCLPLVLYYLVFYIAYDGLRLPVNIEQIYMMMIAEESCAMFLIRALTVTVLSGMGAVIILYRGVRRKCEYA